ncbi:tRNA (5-methylaminomethyl-2-thiouridine)(34)-methyltransferase MnmD [Subsaximicrobium wynnwilliamsii]|uniref:tRNA (5-methylaminomethyl-2-thiouridine)(34)-methyltransferase MnmD n=1 Tax=Subsaximicrobium wynnwilliamsii TaxID=291179 RepID=A0A5C6ZEM8_9FLAO|nr:tRNA (5-methylaminomethyl-2-thiouridine)(34)-methyltransferase MnmD [Subsaximicrobium wynnwilliamsii]TXD82029.1 tRNA (5-methylaminomethyl-2-thiouridine)(34)-methyltransferase MnmD [Subsaximicrobium wynnwilliamsii]TXD87231.1 tRNA (5-methylaminomethyl-2-thiouridine)(34)-methyltransferase MnmD [Subsaximicrobium wynnwilliamsii]TXE01489.1 tRNA (5-methylaminomethyl-2-thiouridine)(34)-methyltransferase MnmD [Subsaximicrobium wynnwilliamsii]
MQRKIIITEDGSATIQIEDWNEQYHSVHGAIQEANHVYIKHGLLFCSEALSAEKKGISLLEIGFGTGLNAILSLLTAEALKLHINYVGVEGFPVSSEELQQLNYVEQLQMDKHRFDRLHNCSWEEPHAISEAFTLTKKQLFFKDIAEVNAYDLIYFDAFGARVQPELWTEDIFKLMFDALRPNGVLTTYSAKGSVRRAMQAVGFEVERLAGPPGKREMLRAVKKGSGQ